MSFHLRPAFVMTSALALALVAGGCSSGSKTEAQPEAATAPVEAGKSAFPVVHEDWARLGYRLDWVGFPYPGADSSTQIVAAALYEDIVVLQEANSGVSVLDASNGQGRWSTELTGPLTKWIGITRENAGRLLVASESEVFVIAPATGNLLGRERLERVANTKPVLIGDTVVTGTSTGVVQAHRLGVNLPSWAYTSRGAIEGDIIMVGGYLGAVSQGGEVIFLATSGQLVGRSRVYGPIENNPATDGQHLFVASTDQSVWCFSPTGGQVWRYRTPNPLRAQPVYHEGVLYCDLGEEGLSAFDAAAGTVTWSNKDVHGDVVGIRNGRLVVWTGSGAVTLDMARGDVIEKAEMPGVTKIVPDAFVDGNMYAMSARKIVAKFMPR